MGKKSSYRPGQRLQIHQEKLPSLMGSRHKDKRLVNDAEHIEARRGKAGKDLMKLTATQLRKHHMSKIDSGGVRPEGT